MQINIFIKLPLNKTSSVRERATFILKNEPVIQFLIRCTNGASFRIRRKKGRIKQAILFEKSNVFSEARNAKVVGYLATCDPKKTRESCRGEKVGIKTGRRRFADSGRGDLFESLSLLCARASESSCCALGPISTG